MKWKSLEAETEETSLLMVSPWPGTSLGGDEQLLVDSGAIEGFAVLRDTVKAVRNVKAEYGVSPAKEIPVHFHASSTQAALLLENQDWLVPLARIDPAGFTVTTEACSDEAGERREVRHAVKEGLLLTVPMDGILDPAKERERLAKRRQKLAQEAKGLEKRLASEGFRAKAPAAVVDKAQVELQELRRMMRSSRFLLHCLRHSKTRRLA